MSEQRRRERERQAQRIQEQEKQTMQPNGNGNGNGAPSAVNDSPERVRIVVEFPVGAADPSVTVENGVSPIQLLVAAGILQYMAGKRMDQTIKIQRPPQIAVPGLSVPPGFNPRPS